MGMLAKSINLCYREITMTDKIERFELRISPEEKAILRQKAEAAGLSMAELVRAGVDAAVIKAKTGRKQADPALIGQLAKIGNNLNQIARGVNSGPVDRVQLLLQLGAIERELERLKC